MYNELKRQHKRNYLYFEKIFSIIQDQGQYYKQKSRETKNDGKKSRKSVKSKPIIYDPVSYKFSNVVF